MPEKVVIYTPMDDEVLARALRDLGDFAPVTTVDPAQVLRELEGATGLVIGGRSYRLLLPELQHVPHELKWIQAASAGTDVFEDLGIPPGVTLMSAVGVWGEAVAGHAVALLLALLRKLPASIAAQAEARWNRDEMLREVRTLADRQVMVLGYGDIGQSVAATLRTLGARLQIVASRARTGASGERIFGVGEIDALLPEAEAIVMSLPATPATRHILSAARILTLRPDAVIVNVGRGSAIDEQALADALVQNRIAGAGLDVFQDEPPAQESPLWSCPNLIMTPHIAGFGDRTRTGKLARLLVANITRLRRGERPQGLTSAPSFTDRRSTKGV